MVRARTEAASGGRLDARRRKTKRMRVAYSGLCLAALLVMGGVSAPPAAGAPPSSKGTIVELPLSFDVVNSNTSAVECASDNQPYRVRGWLVAPNSASAFKRRSATLYLHGLNGDYWRFKPVPGYDYAAEMAKLGHISVVIDRLGYNTSDKPAGFATCLGAAADIAHQIVSRLRSATYRAEGMQPIGFQRVALAGHSAGGGIAEVEAYSYRDVDALVTIGHADSGFSQAAGEEVGKVGPVCEAGGERKYGTDGPGGYAFLPTTDDAYRDLFFFNADADVVANAAAVRERDPCGDLASFFAMVSTNQARLGEVTAPTLVVFANNDELFTPGTAEQQRDRFTGTQATLVVLDQTGHVVMLERTAPLLRAAVHDWLAQRGF